ncbi:MAG: hypothetical protein AAB599_00600 [Patescibacteria group bacterium]
MQYQRINITVPTKLANQLRREIPSRSRSRFIAVAVQGKLNRKKNLKKELIKSYKANAKLYREVNKEWEAIDLESWPE